MTRALLVATVFIGSSWAEEGRLPQEARELMARADALASYQAKFVLETKEENGESVRLEGTILFKSPNRRRLEIRKAGSDQIQQILVCDGKTEWQYYPEIGSVYRAQAPVVVPGPHRPFAEAKTESVRFIGALGESSEAQRRFEAAPDRSITDSSPVPVKTIRVDIAERDGLVREFVLLGEKGEKVLVQRYTEVQTNSSVEESAFVFQPPTGVPITDVEPVQ